MTPSIASEKEIVKNSKDFTKKKPANPAIEIAREL